jgi:hypothetical protein
VSFKNKSNFVATCDYCDSKTLDTGEKDSESANDLCVEAGWCVGKFINSSKTMHICTDCVIKQ